MSRLNVRNGNWFDYTSKLSKNTGPTERLDLFGKSSFFFSKSRNLTSYLVDPDSIHMLVSKIKPCMHIAKRRETLHMINSTDLTKCIFQRQF